MPSTRPPVAVPDNKPDQIPSRIDAFLTGITLALCQSSPGLYAYLRDAVVDKEGKAWLLFYSLPENILADLSKIINVKAQKAWMFLRHGVPHTALQLSPSDEEMVDLGKCYADSPEEPEVEVEVESPHSQIDRATSGQT